jgi:hypothetical protein
VEKCKGEKQWESEQKQKAPATGATTFRSNARIAAQRIMCQIPVVTFGFVGTANAILIE